MTYAEHLKVPLRWWVQATMFAAICWLVLVVAVPEPVAWGVSAAIAAFLALGLWRYGQAAIRVDDSTLSAGQARIQRKHVGTVTALSADDARRFAGVDADPRAFLVLRPYLARAVRVEVVDPADPTPYWLVATRHPERLVAALK